MLVSFLSASGLLTEGMRERHGWAMEVMCSGRFLGGGAVGLWDDDIGVVEECSGAEVVVVDGLGMSL